MKKTLLIMALAVCLYAGELGVVLDNKTGLAWQDDYRDNAGEIKNTTWQDALVYCHELRLGGRSDWRLPNIKELRSIVDRSRFNPTIDSVFTNVVSNYYWSSTTVVSDSSYAWFVFFEYGIDYKYIKSNKGYVRCVRGGQ